MDGERKRLLLIDTCGANGVVGLSEGAEVVREVELPGRSASAQITAAVRELLGERGWRVAELDGVGVVNGPGSFTGLRTGLAFAKGLCEAVGLRLGLVSRLAVLARAAGLLDGVAVLDAGREGFYVRVQTAGKGAREWLCEGDELMAVAVGRQTVVAEPRVAEWLAELQPRMHVLRLRDVPGLVWECLEQGGSDVASSDANYVRGESDIYRKLPATAVSVETGCE
jgi:tRNA threonylcarbamoyladenosine biosynthesis protein TsaB